MKAIWINPLTTGSTSLDTNVNPHDVDQIALSRLLEREGFEVWLQEPFAKKGSRSSWKNTIMTAELVNFKADVAIMSCGPFCLDYSNHRYWKEVGKASRAKRFDQVTRWLDSFDGPLYIHITDPRPSFQSLFLGKRKAHHDFMDHVDRARLLVASAAFLDEALQTRAVTSDYWKAVEVGKPLPFNESNDYFCVYPGMKTQNAKRKALVSSWMDSSRCGTIGEIDIKGIPSFSSYEKVTLSEVLDFTHRSTTSLICGEQTHTWLTPRVIQSLMCGTISSVHPEFAGSHHLPSEMIEEQVVRRASEFDVELSKRVYDRQVDFALALATERAASGVTVGEVAQDVFTSYPL